MSTIDKKILVITSCSAKKKDSKKPIKAINLYEGDFFKKVKKFALSNNFYLLILSAKYGILQPDDKILPYNKQIKNENDISALKEGLSSDLGNFLEEYDRILILMGEKYKKVLQEHKNSKFLEFFDKRGLGGYKSLMNKLLKMEQKKLLSLIFKKEVHVITIDLLNNLELKFEGKLNHYM